MSDRPNLSFSICSIGLSVLVSAVFPGSMHIAGREAVMVHEQPRLYKGQRTALFAVAKPHQSAFLLPLKEVVRRVIVHNLRITLPKLLAALIHICLYLAELRGW